MEYDSRYKKYYDVYNIAIKKGYLTKQELLVLLGKKLKVPSQMHLYVNHILNVFDKLGLFLYDDKRVVDGRVQACVAPCDFAVEKLKDMTNNSHKHKK